MGNKARARRIKMILTDVDGTLTDGILTVLPDGEEVKSYHVQDGMAVLLAQIVGLKLGIITGKTSRALEKRAEILKIGELHQGAVNKLPVFEDILARHGLRPEEVAYIGDDLGDVEILRRVGLAAVVQNAHPSAKKYAHFVCRAEGGRGAYRELIDFIITAQKKWDLIIREFKTIFERRIT